MSTTKNNTNLTTSSDDGWNTISTTSDNKAKTKLRKKRQKEITAFSKDNMPAIREWEEKACRDAYLENQPRDHPLGEDEEYDYKYNEDYEKAVLKAIRKRCGCGQPRDVCSSRCHYNGECESILLNFYHEWKADPDSQLIHSMRVVTVSEEKASPAPRKAAPKVRKLPSPVRTGGFSALMMSDDEDDDEESPPTTPRSRNSSISSPPSIKAQRRSMGK